MVCLCAHSLVIASSLKNMWIRFNPAAIQRTKPQEYAVRFIFGGAVTLFAGLAAHCYGPTVGGLFLAFPAIFPAGVTLLAKHEERRRQGLGLDGKQRGLNAAALETRGAVSGACGLFFFAFAIHSLLALSPTAAALALATLAWFASSVLIWRLRPHHFQEQRQ